MGTEDEDDICQQMYVPTTLHAAEWSSRLSLPKRGSAWWESKEKMEGERRDCTDYGARGRHLSFGSRLLAIGKAVSNDYMGSTSPFHCQSER